MGEANRKQSQGKESHRILRKLKKQLKKAPDVNLWASDLHGEASNHYTHVHNTRIRDSGKQSPVHKCIKHYIQGHNGSVVEYLLFLQRIQI